MVTLQRNRARAAADKAAKEEEEKRIKDAERKAQREEHAEYEALRLEAQRREHEARYGIGAESSESEEEEVLACLPCNKLFRTENAWLNHQKSKKHKAVMATYVPESDDSSSEAEEPESKEGKERAPVDTGRVAPLAAFQPGLTVWVRDRRALKDAFADPNGSWSNLFGPRVEFNTERRLNAATKSGKVKKVDPGLFS